MVLGFQVGLSYGSFGELGARHRLLGFWVFRWPRGVCMVRKGKWVTASSFRIRAYGSVEI